MTRLTVREAARRHQPLDGADAQALEHALTQAEAKLSRIEAETVERCARICDETRHNFIGGAPDWQGGCIASANSIRALLKEPAPNASDGT